MTLVIPLVLKCRVNNTYFKVQHTCIVGYMNVIGDFISRRQWTNTHSLFLPEDFKQIISELKLNAGRSIRYSHSVKTSSPKC